MKTLLCCIGKKENKYIREFVEWYKGLGFTNICLYDNNDLDGERFEEVIGDYIDSGFVMLQDFRGKTQAQIPAYQDCYNRFNHEYDWIAFFDIDEFLEFDNDKNIDDFVSEDIFKDAEFIKVCWKNFCDGGLVRVENNNYSVKRFTEVINEDKQTNYLANRSTKIIVKGGLPNFKFFEGAGGEHGWYLPFKSVDCHGNPCDNNTQVIKDRIWDNAWLNHYRFKTMEESCIYKFSRLYPNMPIDVAKRSVGCDEFFEYNEWTEEKQKYFNDFVGFDKVTVCMLNYKNDDNTLRWYNYLKRFFEHSYIIDTFYVDNKREAPFNKDDDHILLEHNIYFGGQTIKSYEIAKENGSEWLIDITTDVQCNDTNLKALMIALQEIVSSKEIGVWEPSAIQGSMCNGAAFPHFGNIHQYNHGTNGMREVHHGEGFFEMVNMKVADYVIPHLNYTDNRLGWGINDLYNRASRKFGLKVVIDDRVSVYHPFGTSYNNQEAAAEYEKVKARFEELGLVEERDTKKLEDLRTLICCIGKNENRYIREYVDWYKHIGVTNICLYDNNDPDGERFEDIIGKDIEEGYVIYNDWRGRKLCQMQSYQDCYDRFGKEYDWILFIDCGDEYLDFANPMDIKQFLSMEQFENFDLLHINLMTYGDSDKVEYEDKPLMERFPEPIPYDKPVAYDFPENCHISSIVRGGIEGVTWGGWSHTPTNKMRCCNDIGLSAPSDMSFVFPYNFQVAYFRHYTTKTAREYAWKMKRGFPDQVWDGGRVKELLETRFFRTNRVTKEKVDIFKEELGIDMSYLLEKENNVKIFSLCYEKKDFEFLHDSVITPLQVGAANGTNVCELKDNTGDNISSSNFFYIENTGIYWIWKNVKDAGYKGQMQYRRPFIGIDEMTDFQDIFKDHDVITCEPFHHPDHMVPTEDEPMVIPASTVEGGYAFSNCLPDLLLLEKIVKERHPDYAEDWDRYIKNGPDLYYSNGFVMSSENYDKYCEFLFDNLSAWVQQSGIRNVLDLYVHVARNLGAGKYIRYDDPFKVPTEGIRWQTSIGGFLSERLWTLWVQHNFRPERIYKVPYKKMEEGMYT